MPANGCYFATPPPHLFSILSGSGHSRQMEGELERGVGEWVGGDIREHGDSIVNNLDIVRKALRSK